MTLDRPATIAAVLLFFCGLAGAYSTIKCRQGGLLPVAMLFCVSMLTTTLWVYLAKRSSLPLTYASILFDIVYGGSYFASFILLGQRVTLVQGVGGGMAILGMTLLSL